MKKTILGSVLLLAGTVSSALLLAGSMSNNWTVNGQLSFWWNLSQYGLVPAFIVFIAAAVIGLVIAIWGLFDKNSER